MSDTLHVYHDDTIVTLTDEQADKANNAIYELLTQMTLFRKRINDGELDKTTVHTHMNLLEHELQTLSEITGHASEVTAELNNRYKEIRKQNLKIRELTEQLGKSVTGDAIVGALHRYHNIIRAWYEAAGWEYASIEYKPGGFILDMTSELTNSDEAHITSETELFQLCNTKLPRLINDTNIAVYREPGSSAIYLQDTDTNKQAVANLIQTTFPNSRIRKFNTMYEQNVRLLRISVYIPYQDIDAFVNKTTPKE